MEEPYREIDKMTESLVKEAGLQKPSLDFSNAIMKQIVAENKPKAVYTPLISKAVWSFFFLFAVLCGLGLLLFPISWNTSMAALDFKKFIPDISIAAVTLSPTTVYAFVFLSLFLVQIPFLKKRLAKQ